MDVCLPVCVSVCVFVGMYVCMSIYLHSLGLAFFPPLFLNLSQKPQRASRTLDMAVAVAFMLTLKMDEEALDRCIEKTLW